jgi:hypothetical protein
MALNRRNRIGTAAAALAVTLLVGAGCGDDDDDGEESTPTTATTEAPAGDEGTSTTAGGESGDGLEELCALANEMFNQEEFPSAEQVQRYQELAPEEIADAVEVAGAAIAENEGDFVATFAAFADDEVEVALAEINAFENENCDTGHDEAETVPPVDEPEDGATQVDVVASEYTFEFPDVSAGRTSFVLTNPGQEAHFLVVAEILQGTLDEALNFEGDAEAEGLVRDVGDSGIAAPGGEDVEVVTGDLTPGNYAMLCFIPGPDGTPHAFMGMAVEFTVS